MLEIDHIKEWASDIRRCHPDTKQVRIARMDCDGEDVLRVIDTSNGNVVAETTQDLDDQGLADALAAVGISAYLDMDDE